MKLVHAADIHLDSPMHGLAAYDGAPVDELRLAARRAFSALVDLCVDERADLLTIGGDLYDGDWHDYATGAFFAREASRLADAGIPVVLVTGNHDAASRITRSLRLPDSVHVLPVDAPATVLLEDLGVAVHGQGYATPVVSTDLSLDYPAPVSGLINVGLLHTSADGKFDHAPYAPCRVDRLAQRGYDFWGLGHVHERVVLWEDPPILFPGCLQGRSVRETGPKGATVVTFGADGRPVLDARVLDVVRWAVVDVDASDASHPDDVLADATSALAAAVEAAEGRLLAARVRFVGASAVHGALLREARRLEWDLRAAAGDGVWIEKVQVRTTPLVASSASSSAFAADADDALASVAQALAEADAGSLADELAPLAARLPVTLAWDPTDDATLRALLEDVERELPALLLDGGGST
ncbi:metallophosphoesterase family protein [Baekduia sp. Peel2402]|uniref:metallophosphoesterase family protein n=1 Tax=Baekduia sp. Peel2402 TaxID=3458296 RepID=UPI00403E92D3